MAGVVKTLALATVGAALGRKMLKTNKELRLALASAHEACEVVAFLTTETAELKKARKLDKRALDGLAARCAEAQALVQRRDERVHALVTDLARLRRELKEAHRVGTEKEARHTEETRVLQDEVAAMACARDTANAQAEATRQKCAQDMAHATAEAQAAEACNAELQHHNELLTAEAARVKALSEEETRALNEQLAVVLEKLKASKEQTAAISSQSAQDIATLTAKVEATAARYASLQQDNESLTNMVERVKASSTEETRALNEQLAVVLEKLKASKEQMAAISSQSAQDIARLTAEVEATAAHNASLQQDNKSLTAEVERVKASSAEMSAKLCASEAHNARLLKTTIGQEEQISKLQLLIKSLKAENLRLTQAALTKAAEPNAQPDTAVVVRTPEKQGSTRERAPTEAPTEVEEPTPPAEEALQAEEEPAQAAEAKQEATLNAVRRFTLRATAPAFKPAAAAEITVEPTPPAPVAAPPNLKLNPCAAPFVPLGIELKSPVPLKACVERAVATIITKPALSLVNEATETTEAPKPAGETQGPTATSRALPEQPAPAAPLPAQGLASAPDNAAPDNAAAPAATAAPAPAKPGAFFALRPVPPPCPRCMWIFERRQDDPNDR